MKNDTKNISKREMQSFMAFAKNLLTEKEKTILDDYYNQASLLEEKDKIKIENKIRKLSKLFIYDHYTIEFKKIADFLLNIKIIDEIYYYYLLKYCLSKQYEELKVILDPTELIILVMIFGLVNDTAFNLSINKECLSDEFKIKLSSLNVIKDKLAEHLKQDEFSSKKLINRLNEFL